MLSTRTIVAWSTLRFQPASPTFYLAFFHHKSQTKSAPAGRDHCCKLISRHIHADCPSGKGNSQLANWQQQTAKFSLTLIISINFDVLCLTTCFHKDD